MAHNNSLKTVGSINDETNIHVVRSWAILLVCPGARYCSTQVYGSFLDVLLRANEMSDSKTAYACFVGFGDETWQLERMEGSATCWTYSGR
jgi:hypothetical protein